MKRNIVTKSVFPPPPYVTELASFHIAAVPTILGALVLKSQKYFYASPDDWHLARKSLAYHGAELLMPSGIDIVNSIDRVYTLLDAGLFGTARSVMGGGTNLDPFVYAPPLEQARGLYPQNTGAMVNDTNALRRLLDNVANGTVSDGAPDGRSFRDQLEQIRAALEAAGADGDEIEGILQLILLALG